MTKDLALLVGKDQPFLNTQDFLGALDEKVDEAGGFELVRGSEALAELRDAVAQARTAIAARCDA